jgi:hypothetical protein
MKGALVIALLAIVGALGAAGLFMLRPSKADPAAAPSKRMARALAVRVGLSVALFLFILLSYKLGWISPKGVPIAR